MTNAPSRIPQIPASDRSVDDEGTGLLEALWRYKLLSVAIVAAFALLGALAAIPGAGRHTATVTVALKDPRGSIGLLGSGVSSSDLPRYTVRRSDFANAQTTLVLAASLARTDVADVRDHVTITPDANTDAFRVVATAGNSEEAARLAISVARAYRTLSGRALDEQFAQARDALDAEKAGLLATLDANPTGPRADAAASSLTQLDVSEAELAKTAALFGDGVEYIDQARVQSTGTSVIVRNTLIGALFGLLVAALVTWFLAARRPWADDADRVSQIIDAPFLGEADLIGSTRRLGAAFKESRDGYELVSTTLSSMVSEGVLLVVSPTHGVAHSATAVHAALAAVHDGRDVLVVDADNSHRSLSQALNIADGPGLINVLKGTSEMAEATSKVLFDRVRLTGLAAGPQVDNAASLYQSQKAMQFLAAARSKFELVIVDCAPLFESATASALARGADTVVLVVEAGTPLRVLKRANQQLSLLGLPVVGFVFVQRRTPPSTAARCAPVTSTGRLQKLRRSNARAVAVIASQGVSAASSLILALIAARELGSAGLGEFTVLWAVLVFYNSAQTGWLGDSLTVLPRYEPTVRRALFRYQWVILVGGFLVGAVAVFVVGAGGWGTAVLFGLALAAWVAEETGRRLFLARLEFGELLLNDTIYAVVVTVIAIAFTFSSSPYSLNAIFFAMIVASIVAIIAAVVRLPKEEFRPAPRGSAGMREVSSFGAYRAAQISVRPLALLAMRSMVLAAAGASAVGRLEVGRLLIAPAITLINGAGAALLPLFRHELGREHEPGYEHEPGHGHGIRTLLIRSTALLGIGAAICCAAALILAPTLADLLTNGDFGVNSLAVLSWGLFTIAFGLGVPAGNAAVAQGRAKLAFWIRVVDSAIGLTLALLFTALAPDWAPPLGLAIGATVGMVWLLRVVLRDPDHAGSLTGI